MGSSLGTESTSGTERRCSCATQNVLGLKINLIAAVHAGDSGVALAGLVLFQSGFCHGISLLPFLSFPLQAFRTGEQASKGTCPTS